MIKHLACVMDGNRRWAKERGMQAYSGHREGMQTVKRVANFCIAQGIPYLSLYTLSIENLNKRSEEEKTYLFDLISQGAQHGLDELIQKGVRIRFIGDRSLFPVHLIKIFDDIEKKTAHLTVLNVSFLFCYGARQEIIAGVKNIVRKVKTQELSEHDINEKQLEKAMWTHELPELDVLVRTGKVIRLSNFLLYQAAYSELYFPDCLWPELTVEYLEMVVNSFITCQRNFGV